MAYVPINSTEIAVGEPVRSDTQTKLKDNFDNHETRILAVESGNTTVYQPIIMRVNGSYNQLLSPGTNILRTTMNFNLTVTGVRLLIDNAGVSGTTEIDLLYKRGAGAWTSILTTKPSVIYSAGSNAISSNTVLNAGQVALQAGDLLRMDLTSSQDQTATNFMVRVDFSKT